MTDERENQKAELDKLFDKFRDLNSGERNPLFDYSDPCQFEVFWAGDPLEFQVLVVTHDANRPDREIKINGPYKGHEFIDEVDRVLNEPRWKQPIEDGFVSDRFDYSTGTYIEPSIRRQTILPVIQDITDSIGREVFSEHSSKIRQASRIYGDCWAFFIRGELNVEDMVEIAEDFGEPFKEDEKESTSDEPDQDEEVDEEKETTDQETEIEDPLEIEPDGFGTYFYEPVWIDQIPEPNFRERVFGRTPVEFDTVKVKEFGDNQISITRDGFIAVNKLKDKNAALKLLNTIFGASIFTDFTLQAATRNDLVEVIFDGDDIESRLGRPSLRREVTAVNRGSLGRHNRSNSPFIERDVIYEEDLNELLNYAEEIYANEEVQERVNSTLQAYTHHVNGEYSQAFLLSWIAIEQYVNSYLNKHLKENDDVNSKRRGKITDSPNWTSTHKIELLEISNAVSGDVYDEMDRLRSKRNNIVHEMKTATELESEDIIYLAFSLIRDELSDEHSDGYRFDI